MVPRRWRASVYWRLNEAYYVAGAIRVVITPPLSAVALVHGDATLRNRAGQQNSGIQTGQLETNARTPAQRGEGDLAEDPASVTETAESVDNSAAAGRTARFVTSGP
ncbi:hypothetical protein [Nocardia exalbida]|uniref:hypothetical protein n=1 Tax=Nocardia exalbida TaxID=290231 RepID=UPI000592BB94|nr:hypothetical protein [Nocardia exalbida]